MPASGNGDPARARQLIFDLAQDPSFDPDEFLVSSSNREAHATIERWPDWPSRTLLLLGPAGSGKSHLGAIWAAHAGARVIRPGDKLDLALSDRAVIFLEDADRAAHSEALVFHLVNLVEETGGGLLVTARAQPDLWGLRTPDLLSRLRCAQTISIGQPDNALVRAVIVKLFSDRQILVDEDVVAYTALHCERSIDAIGRFVAAVDDAALATGRRITRSLAARTMDLTRDDALDVGLDSEA